MLSVLVGHAYFLRFDRKQFDRAKPYPPLATLEAAALVRDAGHRVSLFDAMLAHGTDEFEAQLQREAPQLLLLYEDNYNYLSKMCLGRMRDAACRMIGAARRAGVRVIAAGSDASDEPEAYLRAGAEWVLAGEGLTTLQALLARIAAQPGAPAERLIEGLGGVTAWADGRALTSAPTTLLRLAAAPAHPAWDLVDIERYRSVWQRAHGRFSLNMAASKGCSFRCAWCAKPIWGQRYQQRSAEAVAAEMVWLKQRFAPGHVWFADDIFGMRADWVRRFAAAVRATTAPVPFTIQTRADLISPAMAAALAEAGCVEAWIGAESGSQKVLDAMDKGTTVQEIVDARRELQAQGIRVGFFIQLGYLGEDLEDLLATRALIDAARPDAIGVSVAYPLPGTRFHESVKHQLGPKTHWDDSGELAMMFRGSFDSAFYRAVRDLLHAQVEGGAGDAELSRRWQALLARAELHRNALPLAAEGVAAP